MTDPSTLNRRQTLAGLGSIGLGALALVGVSYWRQTSETAVRSNDDDTTVHSPGTSNGTDDDGTDDGGDPIDTEKKRKITIQLPKGDHDRFNSDSISFVHDGFYVCNRGKSAASVWIDADPVTNDRGEPAVRFYRDGNLGDRIDSSDQAAHLEADSCLRVGVMTRTFGIAGETTLVEKVDVRTERKDP
ncbi:hypothetical protein [Natronosalvus vescus]|uniref:hypothetical protein n=1 Tax=Natronosalvus vescus TaxID=2953881 RepID=UPI002090A2B4|nr:hypothetical protein [Natronosalvus vescus]